MKDSFLYTIRCDNCGAEYRINTRGEMNCPYCGSKIYLSDEDFKKFLKTRDNMLRNDKDKNDFAANNGDIFNLYNDADHSINLEFKNGVNYHLNYTYYFNNTFVSKDTVAILLDTEEDVNRFKEAVEAIDPPSADIKGLTKYIPHIIYSGTLKDGRGAVILSKFENVYPLRLFSNRPPHDCWIVSRLENLGCLLTYSKVALDYIEPYINPKTHELFILGGWETGDLNPVGKDGKYLELVREWAGAVINDTDVPSLYKDFMARPAANAYEDFERWNNVIENGFDGHRFHKFEL